MGAGAGSGAEVYVVVEQVDLPGTKTVSSLSCTMEYVEQCIVCKMEG